jgi:hypothetical protein
VWCCAVEATATVCVVFWVPPLKSQKPGASLEAGWPWLGPGGGGVLCLRSSRGCRCCSVRHLAAAGFEHARDATRRAEPCVKTAGGSGEKALVAPAGCVVVCSFLREGCWYHSTGGGMQETHVQGRMRERGCPRSLGLLLLLLLLLLFVCCRGGGVGHDSALLLRSERLVSICCCCAHDNVHTIVFRTRSERGRAGGGERSRAAEYEEHGRVVVQQ